MAICATSRVVTLPVAYRHINGAVPRGIARIRQALSVFASTLNSSATTSPVDAAIALAAFNIGRSAEGARRQLMDNVPRPRADLAARAFTVAGQPSGFVPVIFAGAAEARLMTREVTGWRPDKSLWY